MPLARRYFGVIRVGIPRLKYNQKVQTPKKEMDLYKKPTLMLIKSWLSLIYPPWRGEPALSAVT